ncbi:short-chain dehydrogenase [Xylariaceae sp. FL0255]|nr:short-chain dehydrogenase [Xylariaceae sp. FL0255]
MASTVSLAIEAVRQLFPSRPSFTEGSISDLSGKVYIVTGANTGIGKEVARILYTKNAAVWLTSRDEEKGMNAIASIKDAHPTSRGRLELMQLDLSDLSTIKASVSSFLEKEKYLHVLFNNAGVMFPDPGSTTAQGHELQLGVNCLGHFLFTQLLTPTLAATAQGPGVPGGSVRVVWVASSAAEHLNPWGGMDLENLDYKRDVFYAWKYGISKAGNYYQSTEYARRHRDDGIVSVSLNPGNLRTELDRNCYWYEMVFRYATIYPAVNGAYTELFAGLSDAVGLDNTGAWIVPWGRVTDIWRDLLEGSKSEEEGGTGIAAKFWKWCEEQTCSFT